MPPIPPTKKKPVAADPFSSAFDAAVQNVVPAPTVSAPKNGGDDNFDAAFDAALSKKKVGTSDVGNGSTTTSSPSTSESSSTASGEYVPPSAPNGVELNTSQYDLATLNGIIQPEGTFNNSPAPVGDNSLKSILLGKNTGAPSNSPAPAQAVKVGEVNLPDIKEAIDTTVQKNLQRKRGVYDKKLPPPTKDEIAAEQERVTQAYKSGDITPAKNSKGESVMKRGTGFIESFSDAVEQTAKHNQENDYFASLSKEEKIKYLNLNQQHPEVFTPESETAPSGVAGDIGAFVGENAGMLAKGAVGSAVAAAVAPATLALGASNVGSFIALANEFGKGGYKSGYEKTFYALKQQGLSDDEAADKAEKVGLTGEATQLAVAGVLGGSVHIPTGLEVPPQVVNGVLDGIGKSAVNMIKKEAPKMAATSGAASLIESGAEAAVGVNVDPVEAFKGALSEAGHGAVIAASFWALHEPMRVPSYLRPQFENVTASLPVEAREEYLNRAVAQGVITEQEKINVSKTINQFGETKPAVSDLPIPEEKKAAITGKLVQVKKIQQEIDSLQPYGASFNDRIAQLEAQKETIHEDINQMYGAEDVFAHEADSLTGERPVGEPEKISEPIETEVTDGTPTESKSTEAPAQEEIKTEEILVNAGDETVNINNESAAEPQAGTIGETVNGGKDNNTGNDAAVVEKSIALNKKAHELTPTEYENERLRAAPIFNEARHISDKIMGWSSTDGLYEKYLNSKGVQANEKGVYEDTNISDVEDYMRFLLKNKADFFSKEDFQTYKEYKSLMDRDILPEWDNHKTLVEIALHKGESVPKSVLESYPDLSEPETQKLATERDKKVKELESARDEEIRAASKPDLKLNLVDEETIANKAPDPFKAKREHDSISKRFEQLELILKCLHGG